MYCLCSDCRRRGRCRRMAEVERETFFSLGDGREVECDDHAPTWQARLAA